jgi:hypothetical protein
MENTASVKENFEKQLGEVEIKIKNLEKELENLKEYKFKLIGGLETLMLLESPQPTFEGAPCEDKED